MGRKKQCLLLIGAGSRFPLVSSLQLLGVLGMNDKAMFSTLRHHRQLIKFYNLQNSDAHLHVWKLLTFLSIGMPA